MPRLAEIKQVVGETQIRILENATQLGGSCEHAKSVAKELEGWVYLTTTHSNFGWDHKIAVVKQKGSNAGLVIDVTQQNPFVGIVTTVLDSTKVTQELEALYQISQWELMLDYSHKGQQE